MEIRAHDIVLEYIWRHLDKSDDVPTNIEVYTVWKCKALQNWKFLISSSLLDGMYYELTFNGDKGEWYLDAYKKFENQVIREDTADTPQTEEHQELEAYRKCIKSRSFWDAKHCDGCHFYDDCPFNEREDAPQTYCDTCKYDLWNNPEVCGKCVGSTTFGIKPRMYEPKQADIPQTEDDYFLELMNAVERGEMSDAGANQAWYEYINKKDTPQTDCGWK